MSHKIGILGTGHIAHKMASTIAQMDGYENYAVASRSQDKACQFAAQYQIPHAYGSYEALAADPEVELIYIATPHSSHYDNARLCVLHDKPVLCEKAFTANALEAERLLVLAKERGVFITEAIWTRYMPLMLKVVQLVNEGAIGRPNTLSANLSYVIHQVPRLVRPELAGGSLLDIGIYPITFAAMVFGSDIERTVAVCSKTDTGDWMRKRPSPSFSVTTEWLYSTAACIAEVTERASYLVTQDIWWWRISTARRWCGSMIPWTACWPSIILLRTRLTAMNIK